MAKLGNQQSEILDQLGRHEVCHVRKAVQSRHGVAYSLQHIARSLWDLVDMTLEPEESMDRDVIKNQG